MSVPFSPELMPSFPPGPKLSPSPIADDRLLALLQKALGHELPNQLIAVQGLARLLDAEALDRLGAEGRDYLQRLAGAAQRAHELVHALADLMRALRAPRSAFRVPLPDVLREAALEANLLAASGDIEYHFPPHGPYLTVPAMVLRQISLHLLRHVRQLAPAKAGVLEAGARDLPDGVEFWVHAPGNGLTAEQQQKLFEPFACRDHSGVGFGLGPMLARQIVESWGGSLTVNSAPGQGSTYWVRFPAFAATAAGREQEHA